MQFFNTIDLAALFWFQAQRQPWLDAFMEGVTYLGDRLTIVGVVLAAFALCVLLQQVRTGLLLIVCVCLAAILSEGVKGVVKRPRPDVAFSVVARPGSGSFPSGHAMLSTVTYGCLALAAARRLTRRSHRLLILLGAGVLILLIGVSRLYLGVHFVTDVVAGWFGGGAFALLFLWLDQRWGWLPASQGPQVAVPQAASLTTAATPGAGPSDRVVSQDGRSQFRS